MYINCINKSYIHQLHNTVVLRVAKYLHSHLLPDGAHIVFRPVKLLICQQVLRQSQSMGTTVTTTNHHMDNH